MKYDSDYYVGSIRITANPHGGSATVERQRKSDGVWVRVPAVNFLSDLVDWLNTHQPGMVLVQTLGSEFYWNHPPVAATP